LGLSILLKGRGQIANRLLLYLSVFGFSYTLQASVKNQPIAPFVLGFSMMDRVIIGLIPCTLILSATSIIGTTISRDNPSVYSMCDGFGVLVAAAALYIVTLIPVTEYLGEPPWVASTTYSLMLNTGWYGPAIFSALFTGMVLLLIRGLLSTLRQRVSKRKERFVYID
jgi:hypothetical protein